MKRLLALLTVIVGCQEERHLPTSIIPQEVQIYYDAFFQEAENRGISLEKKPVEIIIVDNLDGGGIASRSKKIIYLNSSLFRSNDLVNTEYAIFHELGHYQLGRNHEDHIKENGQNESMMHWNRRAYTIGSECLRDYYLDELFGVDYNDFPNDLMTEDPRVKGMLICK